MVTRNGGTSSGSGLSRWWQPLGVVLVLSALVVAALSLAGAGAGSAVRSRVNGAAAPANGDSDSQPIISADGRFVAFDSDASNLVAGDTNGNGDSFVRDRMTRTTERVSVSSRGAQTRGDAVGSYVRAMSADGRLVAFYSDASKLVPGDTNGRLDAFVRDRAAGTTERVSVSTGGGQANGDSYVDAMNADGRFVGFESDASNLVVGDTNGRRDVFVRDRVAGTTERVSVATGGVQGNYPSDSLAMSADGRFVAFDSTAWNLVSGDTNGQSDVFVRDRVAGTTARVSVSSSGLQANDDSSDPAISADGRFVVFDSTASNLVVGDANKTGGVFVRDRLLGVTERVDVSDSGAPLGGDVFEAHAISADGRFVVFDADTLFVRDRTLGTTQRVDTSSNGARANGDSLRPAISSDGRSVAFTSNATNLVAGKTKSCRCYSIFVRDLQAGMTSLVSVAQAWAPQAGKLTLRPSPARAGRPLTATLPILAGGGRVARAKVRCAATLDGRKLPPTTRRFTSSRARCVWQIPKTAHSKTLTGSISATTISGTASNRFAGPVAHPASVQDKPGVRAQATPSYSCHSPTIERRAARRRSRTT